MTLFSDFPSLLRPGDLLVLNDSRVIPARLYARRTLRRDHEKPTGRIEVMLTEPAGENQWRALVRPGRKVAIGERLVFPAAGGEIVLEAEVLERGEFGERLLEFAPVDDFFAVLDRIGHMPLPPYIRRDDADADRERYQTVFSHERGSVAAPTAGLHFTAADAGCARRRKALRLRASRCTWVWARLLRCAWSEWTRCACIASDIRISAAAADAINRAVKRGTGALWPSAPRWCERWSTARLLARGEELRPHSGATEIFISPGFEFRLVGALLTNFHLPQSSLLMLVSAFAGRERVLAAYGHAVEAEVPVLQLRRLHVHRVS